MKVEGRWRRAVEVDDDGTSVRVLDQTLLPFEIAWRRLVTVDDAAHAIRTMVIRGAPLIGATAAWGLALAAAADPSDGGLRGAAEVLAATRPTAVNLRWALDRMVAELGGVPSDQRAAAAWRLATAISDEEVERCRAIGEHGQAVIAAAAQRAGGRPVRILTHCNAGWLATVDWGTALAPIYRAHDAGVPIEVWVDETRPRNQGLLTAWELAQHGVPHTVIADNAGGHLMQHGRVDLCIVGTDRTTRTGDVCNKIGTYLKALAAHDNRVPFYVAAPSPSIDWSLRDGAEVPIEERDADEVRTVMGRDPGGAPVRVAVVGDSPVANPAFDVTPARLVTGLITERGCCPATAPGLAGLFPEYRDRGDAPDRGAQGGAGRPEPA